MWLAALVVALVAMLLAVGTLFSWMVNETHFDRPSAELDAFADEIAELPGVVEVQHERWVEAPLFTDPISWVGLSVDREHLGTLLGDLCASAYPSAVSWSIRVATEAGGVISLHSETDSSRRALSADACPTFGFDAEPLVDELAELAPALSVQPAIWGDGRFALVSLDDAPSGYAHLLPLVQHSTRLLLAAGLDATRTVEVNSTRLGATILPGQQAAYVDLLTELADEHEVTSFWADGGGTPVDGVDRVHVTAPAAHRTPIEDAIRASGLHIADFPVEFHDP